MSTDSNEQNLNNACCQEQQALRQARVILYSELADKHRQMANAYAEQANSFR